MGDILHLTRRFLFKEKSHCMALNGFPLFVDSWISSNHFCNKSWHILSELIQSWNTFALQRSLLFPFSLMTYLLICFEHVLDREAWFLVLNTHSDHTSHIYIAGVANANIVSNPDADFVPLVSEHDHGTPSVQPVNNTGKLPVEQVDPQMYVPGHFSILWKQKLFRRFLELRRIIRMVIAMLKCGWNEI